jgi:hypothetical protein
MATLVLASSPAPAMGVREARAATTVIPPRICTNSSPSLQQLAVIDTTGDADYQCLGVLLESGAIRAIRLETHHFVATGPPPGLDQVKIEEFPPAIFESSRGAVLDGIPGHDAIVLRGQVATPPGRLALVVSFLYDGFTGEYHDCGIAIVPSPDIGWHLVDRFDQTIFDIEVRTRRIPLIGVFGIANLDGACS